MGGGRSKENKQQAKEKKQSEVTYQSPLLFLFPGYLLRQRIRKLEDELQKSKDSKRFPQIVKQLKISFLKELPNLDLKPSIPRKELKQWHVGFMGKTSAGKSSLLNKLFTLKQKVSHGKCTIKTKEVFVNGDLHVWDIPGFDDVYDFRAEALAFINSLDAACVLYDGQINDIAELTQVLWAMKKEVYHLRTKCDNADEDNEYTIEQEIQRDKQDLKKIQGCPDQIFVFATSKKSGFDNEVLLEKLISTK